MELSEADEAAMAQAMGFSSFGAQDHHHPQKKRRYNPHADAAMDIAAGQDAARRIKDYSTGSNATPLAQSSRKQADGAGNNTDEIALGDDDDDDEAGKDTVVPIVPDTSTTTLHIDANAALPARPAGLPARPGPGTGPVGFDNNQRGRPRPGHGPGGRPAGASENEIPYDALSNANPWERLEKSMGLESKGTWIPLGSRSGVPG